MAQRRKIIIGNWKMNGRLTAGLTLAKDLVAKASSEASLAVDIVVCPPASLLWPVSEVLTGSAIKLGAQDCHYADHGAYTGDISSGMLTDLGCKYVILGHSERRTGHGETNELIAKKVAAAQLAGLTAVLCIGETQEEKASGRTEAVIEKQLRESMPKDVKADALVIGYEPIWAIGTGAVPTLDEIEKVHRAIRKILGAMGEAVRIVYGGSVAPNNAATILTSAEVDGALVGGASLNSDGFWEIAQKAK